MRKLTREDRRQIQAAVARAKRTDKKELSAQDSIPYRWMWPDGICRVTDTRYTKCVQFQDITYELSQSEDKNAIFEAWSDFLNYFDSSVQFQFCFVNIAVDADRIAQSVTIPPQGDDYDSLRAEFTALLQAQLAKGNNGLQKSKYLIFGVEAIHYRAAKTRLERVEADLLNKFKRLGVVAAPMDGAARLAQLHGIFHMDDRQDFQFKWDWLAPSGLNTKDFIVPSSFAFGKSRFFRMGTTYGAASFINILAPELNDSILKDLLSLDSNLIVSLIVKPQEQVKAIKEVKRKLTDINQSKIEEQMKAVRSGYDMDIIPSDLATYGADAQTLLRELQNRNEKMFRVTFLVINTGKTLRELKLNVKQTYAVAQQHNCPLVRLDFQQEQGLMSALPLGNNQIEIERGLTTTSLAIFIPFVTQELCQFGGEALYYGVNALTNNLIMADRKLLKTPCGLILGKPGSGKSFATKQEIGNAILVTGDDIIINDPENEYTPMVRRFHGQIIKISASSRQHINPLDINLNYADEDDPLSLKADFVLSLCELIVGGRGGLDPIEKTVIDRAVRIIYRPYIAEPRPENLPILQDLYDALRKMREPQAKHVAAALELYVTGSLNVFNHRTDVDVNNRIVCYDTKDLGKQLQKLGMLIVQDQVWNRVTQNRAAKKSTRYYVDEMHLLLKEEQTASYMVEIWKRFRKWGGIVTGITQNVKDLLASREVESIFENSDFILMLNQASGDQAILAKQLHISPSQLDQVTNAGEGEGLLFYGNMILPFVNRFPRDTELYRLMTTKPTEVADAP